VDTKGALQTPVLGGPQMQPLLDIGLSCIAEAGNIQLLADPFLKLPGAPSADEKKEDEANEAYQPQHGVD
jgi:hypothetical protein